MLAKDIMTSPFTTIDEGHNVRQAIEIVNANKIGAVPLVDAEGRLTGIVTESDLIRRVASSWTRRSVPHTRDRADALADYLKARSWRVKDVMSSPVISATLTFRMESAVRGRFARRSRMSAPAPRLRGLPNRSTDCTRAGTPYSGLQHALPCRLCQVRQIAK